MSLTVKRKEPTSDSDPRILPLYNSYLTGESLRESDILELIIGNPSFEHYLKEFMEGLIFSTWLQRQSSYLDKDDNPFDSVYLADLKPDVLSDSNKAIFIKGSHKIEDRSSQISFDDGLDD